MKTVTCGLCLLASAMFAVAVADAQTSGSGASSGAGTSGAASSGTGSSPTAASSADPSSIQTGSSTVPGTAGARGNFADPRQGAGAQQPGLPGPQQNQFNQPTELQPQIGPRSQSLDPGIQTRQNVVDPNNRFGQQRGFNFQNGAADPWPTQAERQAQGIEPEMQSGQGQRGELGVWLAGGGGPGVQIRQVTAGSAAEEIGLRAGDMILQINGQGVTSPMEVQRLIRSIPAGQTAMLEVWRDGAEQEVSVTLQPVRASYRSGYRGAEMGYGERSTSSGDLESRTMRLEEQLSTVMRELQQIRSEMGRLQPATSGQDTGTAFGTEQGAMQQDAGAFGETATQPEPNEFEEPATQPEPIATETEPTTTAPVTSEPSATETEPSSTEPSPTEPTSTEPAEDLFGSEPAEPEATETTPAEETETETETETDSDADLFQ